MIAQDTTRWTPLGLGRISPAGSIADRSLAERLAAYKRQVAGRYRGLAPRDLLNGAAPGECLLSPKIDGETWFLQATPDEALLLSPAGRIIADIPLLDRARERLAGQDALFAGELYANGQPTRPRACPPKPWRRRVHDLHAALGGGEDAEIARIRFGAFDLMEVGGRDAQGLPFPERADRILGLLGVDGLCHSVAFERASCAHEVVEAYERLVTREGHEGIVIRAAAGPILKVKPEIVLDAAVVGFTESPSGGVAELLLALLRPDASFQLLGRVDTGFTRADRIEFAEQLRNAVAPSAFLAPSRSGALFRFVQPEVVVEVKCNDLVVERSSGEPIRRMALGFDAQAGWQALGPAPAVSMMHAVFRRARHDKAVTVEEVRWSQVSDLVAVHDAADARIRELQQSQILRRDVLTKRERGSLHVRKAVVWKTHKEQQEPLYPAYVAFFTDFAPGRKAPLRTRVTVASTEESILALADAWLAEQEARGWTPHGGSVEGAAFPAACRSDGAFRLELAVSFARTPSVNFHVAVRRIKALANAGQLTVENDDKGRPRFYTLALRQDALIENIRRIENLYRVIGRWKSAELLVNGDPLGLHEAQGVFNAVGDIAACWRQRSRGAGDRNPCLASCALGCKRLRFTPSPGFPGIPREHPAWYAVGDFDGKAVALDNPSLLARLDAEANEPLALCPYFERDEIERRIRDLPEKLDPKSDSARWAFGYLATAREREKPVWVFPRDTRRLPYDVTFELRDDRLNKVWNSALQAAGGRMGADPSAPTRMDARNIPAARYGDVCGQDAAVEAVRDYAETPLKHPELFERLGVRPGRGILLWGPPGTGKTLLARAVAGETDAHIETICGPEVLSKWVGEAERRIRGIFERAQRYAPAVVLIDEIDAIAGARDASDSHHLREAVSQLLVLLDGLHGRGRVLVIATTNMPDAVDRAILRPGRIDRKVYMGPPTFAGRLAHFKRLLARTPTADDVSTADLARKTKGFTGAEIEHLVNEAGLAAIKEAVAKKLPVDSVQLRRKHFAAVVGGVARGTE